MDRSSRFPAAYRSSELNIRFSCMMNDLNSDLVLSNGLGGLSLGARSRGSRVSGGGAGIEAGVAVCGRRFMPYLGPC